MYIAKNRIFEVCILSSPYFAGKRYDAGDKFGCIKAIIDFALERRDLKDDVRRYLEGLI